MAKLINKKPTRRYQISKFVDATSVNEALRLEKTADVDSIIAQPAPPVTHNTELIGFRVPNDDEDDD